MSIQKETRYQKICKNHASETFFAVSDSVEEGFTDLEQKGYGANPMDLMRGTSPKQLIQMMHIMAKWMPSIARERSRSTGETFGYLKELEIRGFIQEECNLRETYPNHRIWEEIRQYAYQTWGCRIGFTHIPKELIYRNQTILFEHAIVVIMEMRKDKIDTAPGIEAGEESQRIYALLGQAVNDIVHYLRLQYGIKCQGHHPLSGMINDCALAVKAGLGWQGRNGLLVTQEFGQRQRIASIMIQSPYFAYTDGENDLSGSDFCQSCGRCIRACPVGAIYQDPKVSIAPVETIGAVRSYIDPCLCYEQFQRTMGCSICVKVCPFSQKRN